MLPFNKPYLTGKELGYIEQCLGNRHLSGDGTFTKKCQGLLETLVGCKKALLTHSGTAALEMAAILLDIEPGDEIILPSYTFVSTASAFVLRGGVPVFVDIRSDTLNIDETKIENAITNKTKAIVVVHYAGVSCEMDSIMSLAKKYNLFVVEDAAQGICSTYKGRSLGSIGHLGCLSFHETKNVISGEGGALLINDDRFVERAEIVREKGTNRKKFFRGQVDKYTWVDLGSSFLPGEIIAAFLCGQLEESMAITEKRLGIWNEYHNAFRKFEEDRVLQRPFVPGECQHNAHMYYILLQDERKRDGFISYLKNAGIHCVFHYVPLHSSVAGQKFGRVSGSMVNTDNLSSRLVRMPLWIDDSEANSLVRRVAKEIHNYLKS